MTSSCEGLEGMSFGFVNRDFIAAGIPNQHFNNYGGEERMWISPEGGQFSLWFKPGVKEQRLDDWYTPPELNEGPWEVVSQLYKPDVCMSARMKLENNSGTQFEVEITRGVRLLTAADCQEIRPDGGHDSHHGIKMVAYETINKIINLGPAMSREKGLISIWILGMFNAGPETVVLAPYKPGDRLNSARRSKAIISAHSRPSA